VCSRTLSVHRFHHRCPHPLQFVRLLPCSPPDGSLESAPQSALCDDAPGTQWDGFWAQANERYYVRCTRADGSIQWFRFADEDAISTDSGARVLALHPRVSARRETRMRVMTARSGRPVLVGVRPARRSAGRRSSGRGVTR
jgi:hypothetical protein